MVVVWTSCNFYLDLNLILILHLLRVGAYINTELETDVYSYLT